MTRHANAFPAWFGILFILALLRPSYAQATGGQETKPALTQSGDPSTTSGDASGGATAPVTHAHAASHNHAPAETPDAKTKTTGATKPPAANGQDLSAMEQAELQNLDVAMQIARRMNIAAPADWQGASPDTDAFSKKKSDLQQAFEGASIESAQVQVLSQTTNAVTQVLAAMQASPVARSSTGSENYGGAGPGANAGLLGKLPLYLATIALLVSLVALWRSWLLARREVEKALIAAGLL